MVSEIGSIFSCQTISEENASESQALHTKQMKNPLVIIKITWHWPLEKKKIIIFYIQNKTKMVSFKWRFSTLNT